MFSFNRFGTSPATSKHMQMTRPLNECAEAEMCIVSEASQTVETTSVRGKEFLWNSSNPALHRPCFPRKTKAASSSTIRSSSEGIETHREYLFNSALGRLRNREQAETHSVVGFTIPPRDPRTELESKELREALNAAIEKLPSRQARVYQLHQSGFWSGRGICQALQISERNLWIMLHRGPKKTPRIPFAMAKYGLGAKPFGTECDVKEIRFHPSASRLTSSNLSRMSLCSE